MAPRAIWSGSISFGLVNVPVKLYSAVKQKDIHFNQLEEKTGAHIKYKRVSEKTGKEADYEGIVKGSEAAKGRYVTARRSTTRTAARVTRSPKAGTSRSPQTSWRRTRPAPRGPSTSRTSSRSRR